MIISLLLKNLKEAQQVLEVFEEDERFNRFYKQLMFKFANTIQEAEEFIRKEQVI
tara:strand:- start:649 stop:813 length:165 start_codon:yes stop_codon:yes gene_type:complete